MSENNNYNADITELGEQERQRVPERLEEERTDSGETRGVEFVDDEVSDP